MTIKPKRRKVEKFQEKKKKQPKRRTEIETRLILRFAALGRSTSDEF